MPQVTITVNGRDYRIACGPGEESHVSTLAAQIDVKTRELTARVGHVSEGMALVMLGLTLADELTDLRREVEVLRDQRGALDEVEEAAQEAAQDRAREHALAEEQAAAAIVAMASRIEALADRLDQA
ncbi:cell division protein ZapA [Roseospira marina]|uniref:Cell division protein ZapA n=1 Tax=Roseospira marina TaxID=140057 RepID=A0A5M6IDI9_9PROT|nr:cell division protein ZapA [Roseospira marina]KAA5605678.1 cell division protein ZapA [Roseospira marina]MBB4313242.1 cell division protein ZapA [Roseospira marina]MBB5086017.1 cell division protein ZapA [Roseospira marina]